MGSMPNELKRQGAPEEQELERKRAELAAREALLADRELELATLNAELSAFNRHYISRVGARYAELDEIEARIAETIAKKSPHDAHASKVAAAARERAAESAQAGASRQRIGEVRTTGKLQTIRPAKEPLP